MSARLAVEVRCYRYACPECGMTDVEVGHLATEDEVHCFVCLVDEQRHVVLRRWHVDDGDPPHVFAPTGLSKLF
jgi:hypothetical protein